MRHDGSLPRSTLRISISDMLALRVRASGNPPSLLYQKLPENAISIIATIPTGTAAVSIPQHEGLFPISSSLPRSDGIVIVYERKPNGRYEAAEALFREQSFGFFQFVEYAGRRLKETAGSLRTIPEKHGYLAPTTDQWGTTLRDGGYVAIPPEKIVCSLTPDITRSRKEPLSSGVIARFPLKTGAGMPDHAPLPVFSRVELTVDPEPDPNSAWTDFVTFMRQRAVKSSPPGSAVPGIQQWVSALATDNGFVSWNFRRGMFCGDPSEWWGERNRRRTLHEGIDFAEGIRPDGQISPVPEGMPVPAILDGEVVGFLDDYINKTVLVRHPSIQNDDGDVFHTMYSHIRPEIGAGPVTKGQILGRVIKDKKAGAPAHLHLTGAWVGSSVASTGLTIDMIHPAYMPIVLINFNSLLEARR